jgi:23S rRNA (guanosine2251-2'-O)-methyltransferase
MLFGIHAVEAALANPRRQAIRILATENAAHRLGPLIGRRGLKPEPATPRDLDRLLGTDAVHQGVALEAEPLSPIGLDEADPNGILLVLDHVTDPQNVGAALRSAAAFGASGVVMTERHSPPLHGALAKAASGALETVPWVRVVNLARALDEIAEAGFWRIGLAGEAEMSLAEAVGPPRVALVLGAEGEGMRHNTQLHCDALARLPISERMESLNVSNAAAIALYAVATRRA